MYRFIIGRLYRLMCALLPNLLCSSWKAESVISRNGQQSDVLPSHWKLPAWPGREMVVTSVCWGLCSKGLPSVCSMKGDRPRWVSFCKYSPRRMLTSQQRFQNFGTKLLAVGFTDVYFVSLKAKRESQVCL